MSSSDRGIERYPSGRRKEPAGVRQGGAAWTQIHDTLARTALRLMAQRGFGEMAMDGVAMESGISKRTLYRHFATKTDLGIAAIRQLPTWQGFEHGAGPIKEQIRAFLQFSSPSDKTFVPVLATVLTHRESHPELLEEFRENVLRAREAALKALLERGQATGEISPLIQPAAVAALATGIQIDHYFGLHPWAADSSGVDYAMGIIWPMVAN